MLLEVIMVVYIIPYRWSLHALSQNAVALYSDLSFCSPTILSKEKGLIMNTSLWE